MKKAHKEQGILKSNSLGKKFEQILPNLGYSLPIQLKIQNSPRRKPGKAEGRRQKAEGKNPLPSLPYPIRKLACGTLMGTLLNLGLLSLEAEAANLGVVKSLDNQEHWSEITERLLSTGVDYCVVDLEQLQQGADLGDTQLLFLPNIERLQPTQLAALEAWMNQGGKLIVSGPTGTLSQPEIRNQLRSLLGAYWAFALPKASSLELAKSDNTTEGINQEQLAGTIPGGVIIPSDGDATTAAVWSQSDNSPAVVNTATATFLGWRWGVDEVAAAELDSAWLTATLQHYNITPSTSGNQVPDSEPNCLSAPTTTGMLSSSNSNPQTFTPRTPEEELILTKADNLAVPAEPSTPQKGALTAVEVSGMVQELEGLLGRFESALLAAEAANSDVDTSISTAIEKLLAQQAIETNKEASSSDILRISDGRGTETRNRASAETNSPTNRVLAQARSGLENFREAIAKRDFQRARREWSQTRSLIWDNYPTDRKLAQPEIRAIWLDRGTIVQARSEKDLAKLFDKLAAAGFNTVFFETVNASYTIYPSRVAPEQNPLVRGWDPLEAAVKLAHEREMELHAWVWIFAAANQRHNALLNQPADYLGPVLEAHPDWANLDNQGRKFHPDTKKAFFDPANPEVQRYLISLLEEIASKYKVDGIQLDYIRYPFQDPNVNQTYGYSMVARRQFHKLTGVDPAKIRPSDRDLWRQWTDFRTQQIDNFVELASKRLRKQNPNLLLSAAVFPIPRPERIQKLQQHWETWAERGDIDMIVPMTYALDTDSLQQLAEPLVNFSDRNLSLILPGIRLLQLPDIVAVDQIQLLRDLPVGGYALFAAENLNNNLHNIFRRTQGGEEDSHPEPVPYRQPLKTAADRYQTLLREWCFLLENNQLKMQESALYEWSQKADELSILLASMAEEPSTRNVSRAKSALSLFRTRFEKWMREHETQQPYQVQVWNNRLGTIERLLNYGELKIDR